MSRAVGPSDRSGRLTKLGADPHQGLGYWERKGPPLREGNSELIPYQNFLTQTFS
jgi:hypothetical protein